MNKKRAIALASATLVAGLVIGNISGAFAVQPAEGEDANSAREGRVRIGPMVRDAGGRMLDSITGLTGLSADEVCERRSAGESVADIAGSAGVDVDALLDAALTPREAALDDAVAAGTITREQADGALERMQERMRERVNSPEAGRGGECGAGAQARERGQRGGGFGGFGGGRGSRGACGTGVCPNGS